MPLTPSSVPPPGPLADTEESELLDRIRAHPVPAHVALIMDGNGRWATRRGFPRVAGHREGVKAARAIVRSIQRELPELMANNVRLRVIGRTHGVPLPVRRGIDHVVRETRDNTGLTLVMAFNYGGRNE